MGMNVFLFFASHLVDRYTRHSMQQGIAREQSHLELLDKVNNIIQESGSETADSLTQKIGEVKEVVKVRMERA